jgi:glycosyltransferase involved in cell wall biosynthesis
MKAWINPKKPKLLILTSSFPSGPADETCGYIRDFARSLSLDFEVQVLAPPDRNANDWPADEFKLARSSSVLPGSFDMFQATRDFNGLAVNHIGAWVAFICSFGLYFIIAIRLAARSDAMCSHWLVPSGFAGALIAKLTGKPHVVVEHSGALHLLSRVRGGRLIARFVVSASERVITVSADLKRKFVALCPDEKEKVEVIPMGVRANEAGGGHSRGAVRSRIAHCLLPAGSDKATILFIGRLTEVKGVDVLVRAMLRIGSARLVVAGDGDQRRALEALARKLSIDAVFLGQVDASERDQLLAQSKVVVVPSRVLQSGRTEGTPVVCLEAMAAGRPVIAARVGGLAEIIVDGHNGLLFEADDELALAEKLNLLISDSGLGEELVANARLTAAQHSWPQVGSRFAEVIKASLNRNDRVLDDQEPGRSFAGC